MDMKSNQTMEMKTVDDSDTVVSVDSEMAEMDTDLKDDLDMSVQKPPICLPSTLKESDRQTDDKSERTGTVCRKPGRQISQDEINTLYESLDICIKDPKASGKLKGLRLEALHVRGVSEMSTDDILEYFQDYHPLSVEWINDFSCNVVWKTAGGAARALLGLSRPVVVCKKGQEVARINESTTSGLLIDNDVKTHHNKEEVIMIMDDSDEEEDDEESVDNDPESTSELEDKAEKMANVQKTEAITLKQTPEAADETSSSSISKMTVDDVDVPVPPGRWRLGAACPKAKALLIRFATKVDKKVRGAEKRSKYYLKHGNPNYGGLKGLISRSCKLRFRQSAGTKRAAPVNTKRSRSPSPESRSDPEDGQEPEPRQGGKHKKIRMRMYADDEEKRQKRRRTGASNPFLATDLQSRLGKVPALKVSIPSNLYSGDEKDDASSDSSNSRNHQYQSIVKEVSQGTLKNASVWSRLELDENAGERMWSGSSDDGDDNAEDDNWQGHMPDLRSKIGSASRAVETYVGVSSGGDLRNKLDKLRRDREIQKHRSPLLIQVTNDSGE